MRIGIAGIGFGAAVHLPVFRSIPGVEVVALAARRIEKAGEIAARNDVAHVCGNIEDMLELPLDAVSLAVPPSVTERAAAAALRRNLAVLAEKPLARNADAARCLAEAGTGRTAMVDFQFAELESVRALKQALEDGIAGRVRTAKITWLSESYAHRSRSWSWKTDADADGGVMAMLGSHVLFLVEHLLGRVVSLEASFERGATARFTPSGAQPAEDTASLSLVLASGAEVSVALSNAAQGGHAHRWEILCDRGAFELVNEAQDAVSGFSLIFSDRDGSRRLLAREPDPEKGDTRRASFRRVAVRFVEAARSGRPGWPDFATGARVQALLDAAAASAAGRRIPAL